MDTQSQTQIKKVAQSSTHQSLHSRPRPQNQRNMQSKLPHLPKQSTSEGRKSKPKQVKHVEDEYAQIDDDQNVNPLYVEQENEGDSDFEFSAEIMEHNTRQQTRECRQKSKLCHLSIYDWMMRVSAMLKLSKQCFYRAIIVMKKFMFLDQKGGQSKVTLNNANLYGLAALLLSNKFENINGNFLAKISHIAYENNGQIDKPCILACQTYILSTLHFHIANCTIIVESILAVLQAWKALTLHTELGVFSFGRFEEFDNDDEIREEQVRGESQWRKIYLEALIYLIDFMMIRKLVEMRVKDIKTVDNPTFYKKIIANILLHFVSYLISQSNKQHQIHQLKVYRKMPRLLASKLQINKAEIRSLQRKSHLLSKQIRIIFKRFSQKSENLHKINGINVEVAKSYCICHLGELSTKYLSQYQPEIAQKQGNIIAHQEVHLSKREDEHETDPFASESAARSITQPVPAPLHKQEVIDQPKQVKKQATFCNTCINKIQLLRGIVNQQFYVPLITPKQAL